MAKPSTRVRLRVSPGSVVSGQAAREKVVQMEGIDRAETERRLEAAS